MRIFNSLSLSLESLTTQGGNLFLTDLQSHKRTASSGSHLETFRIFGFAAVDMANVGWLILQVQTEDETTAPDPPTLSSYFCASYLDNFVDDCLTRRTKAD
jgi:hypothetical protein